MHPDSPTRSKLDLSGEWEYSDDGDGWETVQVPSALNGRGPVMFRRSFTVPAENHPSTNYSVVLYGVNYQSEVAINGTFVSRHTGGYTSQVIPLPHGLITPGVSNTILVAVDNELTLESTIPLRQQVGGWRTYGGIFRDVYLLMSPPIMVTDVKLAHDFETSKKGVGLTVTAQIFTAPAEPDSGKPPVYKFRVALYDKMTGEVAAESKPVTIVPEQNRLVPVEALVTVPTPKLWSPAVPDLYVVRCRVVRVERDGETLIDENSMDTGFRQVDWTASGLRVNGAPVTLRGILWNEEHAAYGSALPYEIIEKDFAAIKTLGANLVRFVYPPHPYVLNLCDRYGLFAIEEIPINAVPTEILSREYYQELTTEYIRDMVSRDRHHASVLAWGIGNLYNTGDPSTCDQINAMRGVVQSVDARPVYFTGMSASDPCFDYVDVAAVNLAADDMLEIRDSLRSWSEPAKEKPLVVVRYGREVQPGNRNGSSDPLSLEAQGRFAMDVYEAMKEKGISASVLWAYNDWHTDRPAMSTSSGDMYLRTMGVVDGNRERRVAFDVIRSLFFGEKVYAIPVGSYSGGAPVTFVVSGLGLLIAFAFIYNGNRRFRDAVNRSLARSYNFFADVRDQRVISYGHSFFLALVVSITWGTMAASVFAFYRDNLIVDNLLSFLMSDQTKERFIALVWEPPKFLLAVSGVLLLMLVSVSVLVRFVSAVVRTPVNFYHTFSVTMWAMLPAVVLIPLVTILYRLMESQFYVVPVFFIVGLVTAWMIARLFKGISIVFDVFPLKVYAVGFLLMIGCGAACYGYLDYAHSTSFYLKNVGHLVGLVGRAL